MVFSSLIFIFLFLPLTIFIYYISPRKLRNLVLLIVSLIFYAWGEPLYILIMIFSTVFDYINGLLMDKYRGRRKITRAVFINSIVINLGILCFFKYYGFVVDNINSIFSLNLNASTLPLPVGISFYTFQTMSYAIDVYLDKVPVQKNIISFGAYVTMFPQLVAGPIVKYGDVAKQLNERKETLDKFGEGAELFIRGLSKKVLLANNIGILWNAVKSTPISELTVISAWLGIIGFTFQIYFDFSGYSDMALGLGKMFGFELMENFNYPYISKSVTEFWRRWHISLGSWFREYVYIPLGGNKAGKLKQFKNLFIVWFLTGLWHGANWNFILWGLYFGFFITIEKLFLLKWLKKGPKFIGHIYTLIIVIVGWVFFEFESLSSAMGFIGTMFGFGKHLLMNNNTLYYLSTNIVLLLVLVICSTPIPRKIIVSIRERLKMVGAIIIPPIYLILIILSTAYLVNETYNPFLYFRF
ncbi:MBOAT family protein [uncultured Clostridium sp.]|uniref:MBOAT family O-acyltransferase n=1 Tax=uncultured Clostridium sp. TaxID=59620 RepID=UPI00258C7983|nr:MBOAT family protein [uncultured Clostridium sp.]MDU1348498.1 MBOAT family protein [Clostridium argentinense]